MPKNSVMTMDEIESLADEVMDSLFVMLRDDFGMTGVSRDMVVGDPDIKDCLLNIMEDYFLGDEVDEEEDVVYDGEDL